MHRYHEGDVGELTPFLSTFVETRKCLVVDKRCAYSRETSNFLATKLGMHLPTSISGLSWTMWIFLERSTEIHERSIRQENMTHTCTERRGACPHISAMERNINPW